MGGATFFVSATGRSPEDAFHDAVSEARYENGHGGYTGTIAEKSSFKIIPVDGQTIVQKREALRKQYEAELLKYQNAKLMERIMLNEDPHYQRSTVLVNEDQRLSCIRECKQKIEDLKSPDYIPYEVASEIAEDLIDKCDPRIDDKWGPAGCIVMQAAETPKPLTKDKAEKLAQQRHGPHASIKMTRNGKESFATLMVSESLPTSNRYVAGVGMTSQPQTQTRVLLTTPGKDANEARGYLFARPGKYLFFGWASS